MYVDPWDNISKSKLCLHFVFLPVFSATAKLSRRKKFQETSYSILKMLQKEKDSPEAGKIFLGTYKGR